MSGRSGMRSPLGRALGLGSAKEGVDHWWAQRVSAVALIGLGLWFAASLIALAGAEWGVVIAWIRQPLASLLLILLLAALFYHLMLGVQVVIEDYVPQNWLKIPSLMLLRLSVLGLAVAAIFAVARIAFGGL